MTDETALAVEVLKRMGAQDETLSEIHAQTIRTNGRVTGLEMREAAREAVRIDRAERLKEEAADKAVNLKQTVDADESRRNRRTMIFGSLCGLLSGAVGYAVLAIINSL